MLIQSVRAIPDTRFRGTLKLFTDTQLCRGSKDDDMRYERKLYKRLLLATYHGIELSADHDLYVEEFKDLNPAFAEVDISYEFVLRKFG